MLLYEHPLSSYAQKVKIALRQKGLPFEAQLPDSFGTGQKEGPFVAANQNFLEFDAAAERMPAAADLYTSGGRRREYRDHRLEWMIKSGGIEVVLAGLRANNIRFSWPEAGSL